MLRVTALETLIKLGTTTLPIPAKMIIDLWRGVLQKLLVATSVPLDCKNLALVATRLLVLKQPQSFSIPFSEDIVKTALKLCSAPHIELSAVVSGGQGGAAGESSAVASSADQSSGAAIKASSSSSPGKKSNAGKGAGRALFSMDFWTSGPATLNHVTELTAAVMTLCCSALHAKKREPGSPSDAPAPTATSGSSWFGAFGNETEKKLQKPDKPIVTDFFSALHFLLSLATSSGASPPKTGAVLTLKSPV